MSAAPGIDPDLDRIALEWGWTAAPIGRVGVLYQRGVETLRILYAAASPGRSRAMREWEYERPDGPTTTAVRVNGRPGDRDKLGMVREILSTPVSAVTSSPAAEDGEGPGDMRAEYVGEARALLASIGLQALTIALHADADELLAAAADLRDVDGVLTDLARKVCPDDLRNRTPHG